MTPPISVVMPVHNALPWLDESVTSILAQSFSDFEFVILDDGSTDGSGERLRFWAERDPRIRLVPGAERLGAAGSSNAVVAEARAPLVARMDADDIAHLDRLAHQVALMDEEPGVVLAGTLSDVIDKKGRRVRPADHARLLRRSRFAPFGHSSIMFRREAFDRAGGYRAEAERWEDVDLYLRMAREGRIAVIPEPLTTVRLSGASTRVTAGLDRFEASMDRMQRAVEAWPAEPPPAAALRPGAFVASGSALLWSGHRPRVLRRLLQRGALRPDAESARALIWAAWADLSPASLRLALRTLLHVRNRAARRWIGGARWIEWRPGEAPILSP